MPYPLVLLSFSFYSRFPLPRVLLFRAVSSLTPLLSIEGKSGARGIAERIITYPSETFRWTENWIRTKYERTECFTDASIIS